MRSVVPAENDNKLVSTLAKKHKSKTEVLRSPCVQVMNTCCLLHGEHSLLCPAWGASLGVSCMGSIP